MESISNFGREGVEYMDLGKLEKDVESRRRQVQSPAFNSGIRHQTEEKGVNVTSDVITSNLRDALFPHSPSFRSA